MPKSMRNIWYLQLANGILSSTENSSAVKINLVCELYIRKGEHNMFFFKHLHIMYSLENSGYLK